MVQTKIISYNATLDAAGSVFYKDIGNAGSWTVPFTSLLSVSVLADDLQYWTSHYGASTTSAGSVRLWKWNATARAVTVTVTGIGLVA